MIDVAKEARAVRRRAADIWNHPTFGERCRAAWRFASFFVRTRLMKRPTVAPLGEASHIVAYPGETNTPLAVYNNPPNPRQMKVWKRHLEPGDLFLDVGANVGVYTIYALELGAEVIAFEPDARSYGRLQEHLTLNGFDAVTINMAVADRPGTLQFTHDLDSRNHLVLESGEQSVVTVPVTTIDEILGDRRAKGMKIDVEGAEHLVIGGAVRALAEHRVDIIQFEWAGNELEIGSDDQRRVPELLREWGYVLFRPGPEGNLVLLEGEVAPYNEMNTRDVFALAPHVLERSQKSHLTEA